MLWYLIIVLFNNNRFIQCSPVSLQFNDDWDPHTVSNKNALLNSVSKTHKLPPLSHRQGKENYDPLQELHLENKINLTTQLGNSIRNVVPCTVCKLGVGLLYTAVQNGEPLEVIRAKFVSTCVGFKIQNEVVCSGVFDVFSPEVLAALKVTKLGPKEICGMFETEVCEDEVDEKHVWTINIPSLSSQPKKERTVPEVNKPTLKVLQISDTHLDLKYLVGSNANCDEPLCCRPNSSLKKQKGVILPAGRNLPLKIIQEQKWQEDYMKNAVTAVRTGAMGYLKAAKYYNLPRSTLFRYCKDDNNVNDVKKKTLGRKPILSEELEAKLVDLLEKVMEE
ncbi:hypothetical protein FQA39_LY02009 [Lamprigera yunnana]|nr:hypothetical protein FQA39_LY02009 [Lamprigera yunnana]